MPVDSDSNSRAIMTQLNVLNSKVALMVQELGKLKNDFSIIAKTVIAHKNEIQELQSRSGSFSGGAPRPSSGSEPDVTSVKTEIENIKEEIKEMKYILDTINPVAYVTVDEVSDIVDQKLKEKKSK